MTNICSSNKPLNLLTSVKRKCTNEPTVRQQLFISFAVGEICCFRLDGSKNSSLLTSLVVSSNLCNYDERRDRSTDVVS